MSERVKFIVALVMVQATLLAQFAPELGFWGGNGLKNNLYAAFQLNETSSTSNATDATGGTDLTQNSNPQSTNGVISNARVTTNAVKIFFRAESGLGGLSAFTVCMWLHTYVTNATVNNYAFSQDDAAGTRGWFVARRSHANGNKIGFTVSTTAGAQVISTTAMDQLNTWYFFMGTYDGANLHIWFVKKGDAFTGAEDATPVAQTGSMASPTCRLALGYRINGGTSPEATTGWNGPLDQVYVWKNRALTGADAVRLYNGGLGLPFEAFTN